MDDVKLWLNSRHKDYDAGVQLYLKYGLDKSLIDLFTKEQESDFKRTRLKQVLNELLTDERLPSEQPSVLSITPHHTSAITPVKGWLHPITDPVIQTLFEQWRPLYAEMMNIQSRIYEVALQGEGGNSTKAMEASQLAHRIIDLDEQVDNIYYQRDFYMGKGYLPGNDNKEELIGDPVKWPLMRQNALRYIRDFKSKIAKDPNNKKVKRWQDKIMYWQGEVNKYNRLLKLDDE